MAFDEVRFPDAISRGARGGPQRRTQIVTLASGDEERNASWANSRRSYDAAYGIRRADDLAAVIAFFEARNGRLRGFRWKDWADYKSALPSAVISPSDQLLGIGDGVTTTFQLRKAYASGGQTWSRIILKPVAGTVRTYGTFQAGGELVTAWDDMQNGSEWSNQGVTGAASAETWGAFTRAYQIGNAGFGHRSSIFHPPAIVAGTRYRASYWFKAGTSPKASLQVRARPGDLISRISGAHNAPAIISQDAGAVSAIQATDLGGGVWLWTFDVVVAAGLTSAFLELGNAQTGTIVAFAGSLRAAPVTGETLLFAADPTTGLITFATPPSIGTELRAGFEFDVPVRFDTDDLPVTLDIERIGSITSIPLIEVRR